MVAASATLIIGAGITGIACARLLHGAGGSVRLIDKGRRAGGRLAMRRVTLGAHEIRFDHGAQYIRPRDAGFRLSLLAAGAVDWADGAACDRLVGRPGMSALPRALAQGLEIVNNTEVTGVSWQGARWLLDSTAGQMSARRLILTVPAPQTVHLLGQAEPLAQGLAEVQMTPCLTLMAAFRADCPAPFATRRDPSHPLTWVARDSSKPGRDGPLVTWVAQAGPEFSATYLEHGTNEIAERMLTLLCDLLEAEPGQALHAQAHRWRYAQATRPLGHPFLKDAARNLYLGGDWCLGARAEDGWKSGQAIARDVLSRIDVV